MDLDLFSPVANVTITVNPDQAPIANNMTVYTAINTSYNGVSDGFDPDNDTLHYSMVTGPLYGVLNLTDDGNFIYTPPDNFTGNDSFTYQTTDNVLNSSIGNVTICVVEGKMPIAYNMIFNIAQNSILNSRFNATGIKDVKKTFNIVTNPVHGILNILGESFTYKPFRNYNGKDSITYNFTDVLKQTSNIATLNIFIRSPPTAENITLSTQMNNKIGSNFKIKGYNSTPQLLTPPKHGKLEIKDHKFTYMPYKNYHGTDTFKYQAIDSLGQKSPEATVKITVIKPKLQTEQATNKNTNQDSHDTNNPYKNLLNGLTPHDLNITTLNNLNMSNLNFMNPTDQMKNQIITFLKNIINQIKNTINQIKL